MTLAVIGAGFGRTGTLSLKVALERLGLGPCYHMIEVIEHPEHVDFWQRAATGGEVDWARCWATTVRPSTGRSATSTNRWRLTIPKPK